jgi:signal transduction histidine kinase
MTADLVQHNTDLEKFAYIISHNLRAPVANIIGASSILNNMEVSSGEKEKLNRGINTSILRLDEIINDLNQILQIKGRINEIKEIVYFSELVEHIKISIRNLIDKDNVEIKYDFSEVNDFFALKPYLYSIFFNLISNSIKYRRQKVHSVIEIRSRLLKNKIELTFADNGMGIDLKKNGDQIFGLYKRFHSNIEGKGMGLFMVKTQVETLGGKISVKSEENKGTEFKIEFKI